MFADGDAGWLSLTKSCPRRMVTTQSLALLSLFRHYRSGHLYHSGGIANQPASYLKAMQIIEGALE